MNDNYFTKASACERIQTVTNDKPEQDEEVLTGEYSRKINLTFQKFVDRFKGDEKKAAIAILNCSSWVIDQAYESIETGKLEA